TGRSRALAQLDSAVDTARDSTRAMALTAVSGGGGVGKSWLALHWAHTALDRFPDGQLYVDLRGFDPTQPPVDAAVAVRGFLDALGVPTAAIPADPQAQAALFRSVVAGRRLLIVLDDARDTAHVLPLLPGSATCTVLVTSRNQLTGLAATHGARLLPLDVLTDTEARQLLATHLGRERTAAEPVAVAALLRWCAGLPLALSIVAARAAARRDFALNAFAEELRDAATRLDALDTADLTTDLRAVFATSYEALPPPAARLFRLLGTVPGPDIGLPAAAALAEDEPGRIRLQLRLLDAAHLLQEHQPGRYRMHDLLRLYAAERCRDEDGAPARSTALGRLVDFYLRTGYAADRLLDPLRPEEPGQQPPPGPSHPLPDANAALAWFDAEHSCLLNAQRRAAEHGWHPRVWQLAWAMSSYHWQRGHLQAGFQTWQAGLAAANQLGAPGPLAIAHRLLARSCTLLGRHAEAVTHLDQALTLFEAADAPTDQAHTHQTLAWVWGQQGDDARALAHATRALTLHRELGNTAWEADALNLAGWYSARLGDHGQAHALSLRALALYRRHGNRNGEAATLDSLGYVAHLSAAHPTALRYYRLALALFRELGNHAYTADTLTHLGETHRALGEHAAAEDAWRQAVDLYRTQQRTRDMRRVEELLATLRSPAIR
ncbi:ATP-binding protein, partial [Catellatospora methionotrophica]|uniref:ATP-binding protein n=1 Tax=Catellatospora methionotrophica TaxID=121620 RepID=UPI0033E4D618